VKREAGREGDILSKKRVYKMKYSPYMHKKRAGFVGIYNDYLFQTPQDKWKAMDAIQKRISPPQADSSAGKYPVVLLTWKKAPPT